MVRFTRPLACIQVLLIYAAVLGDCHGGEGITNKNEGDKSGEVQ